MPIYPANPAPILPGRIGRAGLAVLRLVAIDAGSHELMRLLETDLDVAGP